MFILSIFVKCFVMYILCMNEVIIFYRRKLLVVPCQSDVYIFTARFLIIFRTKFEKSLLSLSN
jgi:hypothetical protein